MLALVLNSSAPNTREKLIEAATETFRRSGFVATTVDDICSAAGVTKGAFFHHFETKESLAVACLENWKLQLQSLHESAPYQQISDPVEKALAAVEFIAQLFSNPVVTKSCLAGTTVQEASETHPVLRDAAQSCFVSGAAQFQKLLEDASHSRGVDIDSAAVAQWWVATLQGSLVLYKASRDESVIPRNLRLFRQQLAHMLKV